MVEKEKTKEKIILEEAAEVLKVEGHKDKDKDKNYIGRLQRLQAEFENFQKRTEKEKQENANNANANLISQLLRVLDSFEIALAQNKNEGMELIYADLKDILNKQGLKVIDTKGKFNAKFHEVLMQEEGKEENVILEEFQKGYLLNDKLLRASKIKISKTSNE
jgi:molecular chaperone GrpE